MYLLTHPSIYGYEDCNNSGARYNLSFCVDAPYLGARIVTMTRRTILLIINEGAVPFGVRGLKHSYGRTLSRCEDCNIGDIMAGIPPKIHITGGIQPILMGRTNWREDCNICCTLIILAIHDAPHPGARIKEWKIFLSDKTRRILAGQLKMDYQKYAKKKRYERNRSIIRKNCR